MQHDLEELMRQSERSVDFRPRVYLYILTDGHTNTGGDMMRFCMTDLAHTCLSLYFSPHKNVVNVNWYQRSVLKQHMLATKIEAHRGCLTAFIDSSIEMKRKLDEAAAILFVTPDASVFIDAHKRSFLKTLSDCLNTSSDKILIESINMRPYSDP